MDFQQIEAPDGSIEPDYIVFTDGSERVWTVPRGHRFWTLYEEWLAQGNTPMPPQN